MPLFKLCNDDQLVNTLHSVFNANIVRVPEARINPLCMVAVTPQGPRFWGYLPDLVEGKKDLQNAIDRQKAIGESPMANVSGKKSRSVNLDLGLQILEGFLGGFGLPSAGIAAKFNGAKTVSFSFQGVARSFISPGTLGKLLGDHALDKGNTANDLFFQQAASLLVTDSVITSRDFSIQVGETKSSDFKLDVPAIQNIVGKANAAVKVETTTGLDITFKGDTPLTFAFTCLRCNADSAGRLSLVPHFEKVSFGVEKMVRGNDADYPPQQLYNAPGLIEWQ
jgi:hypothetical protein